MTQWHSASRAPDVPTPGSAAPDRSTATIVLIALLGVATLALAIFGNGNIALALAPTFGFLLIYTLVKLPLRYPWLIYIGLVLTLDTPSEPFAEGQYKSALRPLAVALSSQLKNVIPNGALIMSGLDVFIVGSLLVYAIRRAKESPLDREGYVPTPLPLFVASWLCLLAVMIATVYGAAMGGSFRFAIWQIQRNIYLPLVFMVAHCVFPNPANIKAFLRLLVGVACIRAAIAILLRFDYPDVEYTSSHSDSMLFGTVTCYLLFNILHGTTRRRIWLSIPVLALLVWGMIANDRRLVWVELGLSFAFVYFMSPWTRLKKRFAQITLGSIPFVAGYVAVGWQSATGIFKPVGILRSMVDSKSDGSTLWRDLENFNLVSTFKHHPVLGTGFGHPFEIAVWMPDITSMYELEPYVPHNSVVGLWAYTGYVGFTLIWLIPLLGAYISARTYYMAKEPFDRTVALTCFCAVLIYLLQCYGDMGLGAGVSVLMLPPLIAMVGKLSIQVGAWPRFGRPRGQEAPAARG